MFHLHKKFFKILFYENIFLNIYIKHDQKKNMSFFLPSVSFSKIRIVTNTGTRSLFDDAWILHPCISSLVKTNITCLPPHNRLLCCCKLLRNNWTSFVPVVENFNDQSLINPLTTGTSEARQ